jgi:hypothetical protein
MMDRSYAKEFVRRANLSEQAACILVRIQITSMVNQQLSPSSIPVKFNRDNAGTIRYSYTTEYWTSLRYGVESSPGKRDDDVSAMNRVKGRGRACETCGHDMVSPTMAFQQSGPNLQDGTPSFEVD